MYVRGNETIGEQIDVYGVNNVYAFYFNIEHSLMCIQYNIFICIIYNNNYNNNIVLLFMCTSTYVAAVNVYTHNVCIQLINWYNSYSNVSLINHTVYLSIVF